MKKNIIFLILTIVLGFGVSIASAESYVSGSLGAVILNDSDLSDDFGDSGELSFDTGFGFMAAIGNSLENGSRVEVELSYRANDMDTLSIAGFGSGSVDGDVTALSLMGNAYYNLSPESNFTPFIGGGLGFSKVEADIDLLGSEDDTVFAYQFSIGGSFSSSETVSVDLQYRFFGTSDPDFDGLEAEYTSHNLMIGLRKNF